MAERKSAKDQFAICTQDCGGRCCRYITVSFSTPRAQMDWDEMRWWLAHEGVMLSKDEDGWLLHIQTPCGNLRADSACGVYPHHMGTCKDYDGAECEFTGPLDYDLVFKSEMDLAHYIERRKLKRAAPIAKDIRAARRAGARNAAKGLVQLEGLSF